MRAFKRRRRVAYTDHDEERFSVPERLSSSEERKNFERDRSRVIHSAAFRRLQGKTQVFTPGESDFFRTRLTHSLEVAQIGKGLALRLGADTDLVETISLIHDIGHPPFGHAGEQRLSELMEPYGGFEANAQNVRILTRLETKSEDYDGLNLTRAVIDGQLKYKTPFPGEKGKFVYEDDVEVVEWASKEARTVVDGAKISDQSFECEIMDWADEVAYAVHDLEDSIHARYITASTFQNQSLREEIINELSDKFDNDTAGLTSVFQGLISQIVQENPDYQLFASTSSLREQKANRKRLTSYLIGRYIRAVDRSELRSAIGSPISKRYAYRVCIPATYRMEVALINRIIMKVVIRSPQIRMMEEKGKYIIQCLFEKFMDGDNAEFLLPDDWKEYLFECNMEGERARVVSDYISGMTDDYAQKTYAKLFLPNQGSIYEVL